MLCRRPLLWCAHPGCVPLLQLVLLQNKVFTPGSASRTHYQYTSAIGCNTARFCRLDVVADDPQVLLEDAEFLMNRVSAGEVTWNEVRPELAVKYEQAGLSDVAAFVAAMQ